MSLKPNQVISAGLLFKKISNSLLWLPLGGSIRVSKPFGVRKKKLFSILFSKHKNILE